MTAHVLHGDATSLPLRDASVDAIVCDPPYGLEFMGKDWDAPWRASSVGRGVRVEQERADEMTAVGRGHSTSAGPYLAARVDSVRVAGKPFEDWCGQWAAEAFRVLKPGGYLLAFGGSRTWHRLACAIEDAGFELRDSIAWMYGSGFPKSLDVSKAIDKAAGAEREVVGRYQPPSGAAWNLTSDVARAEVGAVGHSSRTASLDITAPATDAARQWQGWGTALKPAFEPVVVARKPLTGTVAQNVTMHGTGALNIDGCRVAYEQGGSLATNPSLRSHINGGNGGEIISHEENRRVVIPNAAGRWPSNVVLTHADCDDGCEPGCPVAELDQQSGTLKSGANPTRRGSDKFRDAYGDFRGQEECTPARGADEGGASRFFPTFRYQAKAPSRERPVGPDGTKHPTCKPLDLMRWLVRLVTPPGGIVLDPFAGSGTTLEAAQLEGFAAIGVEKHVPYLPLIAQRIERSKPQPPAPAPYVAPTLATLFDDDEQGAA